MPVMTSNLIVANSYLALSALAPAGTTASLDHLHHVARTPAPVRRVVPPTPLLSLTPSSVKLRAERTDDGVSLTLA
jgi:hypothetical protein